MDAPKIWSFNTGGSGNGIATYPNFAAFPPASSVPVGTLAMDLSNFTVYVSNGTTWLLFIGPMASKNFQQDIAYGNGIALNFTMSHANPVNMIVTRNGIQLAPGIDYSLTGNIVSMLTGAPALGQRLIFNYDY